jgi:ATP-dependent DNA helicase RecG
VAADGAAQVKTPERKATKPKPTPKRAASKSIKDLVDKIAPAIDALKKAQDQARAAGLFPHDRELLWCPRCGLEESVSAHGLLYTWVAPNYRVDTGHRFIEPKAKDDSFICPKCGSPAREDDWERRLSEDHPEPPWESVKTHVPMEKADAARVYLLCDALRTSDRVKRSVKKLGEGAMLERYGLVEGDVLTNLGVLLVGARRERLRLGGVRGAQYDKTERAVRDLALPDAPLWEVPNVIRREIEALDEYEEVFTPVGIRNVPAFDPRAVRELVVNALVHRSYVRRGDIEVRLYSDRLEVESPGALPPAVSRITILRAQRARNERLARLFVDLGLMEGKGAGVDVIFDRQLAAGRAAPVFAELDDRVRVTVPRQIVFPAIRHFIAEVERHHPLTTRERLVLAYVCHGHDVLPSELATGLALADDELAEWLGRLEELGVVELVQPGRAAYLQISPSLMRQLGVGYRRADMPGWKPRGTPGRRNR